MQKTNEEFCQSIADLNRSIETVLLLEDIISAAYTKNEQLKASGFPLYSSTAAIASAILRLRIFSSIMNEDSIFHKSYGSMKYSKVSREGGDILFFPIDQMKSLVVFVKGQYSESNIVYEILARIENS